jgi:putative membrane protein
VKVGLYVAVALLSVAPTLAFVRWRRELDRDPAWRPPEAEHRRFRKLVMAEIHIAVLIPIFAVIMARGLGR